MKKIGALVFALLFVLPATADAVGQVTPSPDNRVQCGDVVVRLGDVQGPRLPGKVLYPTCPPVR
jgi:hypothetical protein